MKQDPNNYWEQLERLEKLIRSSELKAGAIFSFHGLILGLFFDRYEQISIIFSLGNIFIVFASLWLVFVSISVFFCFLCFKPKLELKYDDNVFFYKDAAEVFGGVKEYTKELLKVCSAEEEFFELLAGQIHAESKIIAQKFKDVHRAILFFAYSISIILLTGGLYIFKSVV